MHIGPDHAKPEIKPVHAHDHGAVKNVVRVETIDHLGDGQRAAFFRTYFIARDTLLAQ